MKWTSLNNVDWDKLHKQKQILIKMLNDKFVPGSDKEEVWGIINLLDAIQDEATDLHHLWKFPVERIFRSSSQEKEYKERDGQCCTILRELTDDERTPEVDKMYKIQFADGKIIDAFVDEVEGPSE